MGSRLGRIAPHALRAARGLWPDRNPLRPGLDRAEAFIAAALSVAFLIAAPLAAQAAGDISYRVAVHTAHVEQSWRQVPAELLANAKQAVGASAPASWRAPDGARRSGAVPVPPGAQAGSTIKLWVDPAGRPTGPPFEGSPLGQAVLGAVIALMGLAGLLCIAGLCSHCLLARRRLAAWESDWQVTEPQWTGGH
jgi:hypothetical protein